MDRFPLCSTGLFRFGTAALLPLNQNHILLKQGTGTTDQVTIYCLWAAIITNKQRKEELTPITTYLLYQSTNGKMILCQIEINGNNNQVNLSFADWTTLIRWSATSNQWTTPFIVWNTVNDGMTFTHSKNCFHSFYEWHSSTFLSQQQKIVITESAKFHHFIMDLIHQLFPVHKWIRQ